MQILKEGGIKMNTPTANKSADFLADLTSFNIFRYLTGYRVLDFYNIENISDLVILTNDFNDFAKTNNSPEKFYERVKLAQKILNTPKFSFFRKPISNIYPYREITLAQLYEITKVPKYYALVTSNLRCITNKAEARKYKAANFDYVTISGTFSKRNESCLIQHSDLLVLDFDNVEKIDDLKRAFLTDGTLETQFLFTSPSGTGLKSIVKINTSKHDHETYFKGIQNYIKQKYSVEIDPSGKDVCRACFVCYDPEVYINPNLLN